MRFPDIFNKESLIPLRSHFLPPKPQFLAATVHSLIHSLSLWIFLSQLFPINGIAQSVVCVSGAVT